jgi:hypothetical protein
VRHGVCACWSVSVRAQAISSMASDYYPEQLGMMFIINCPLAFRCSARAHAATHQGGKEGGDRQCPLACRCSARTHHANAARRTHAMVAPAK